MEHMLYAKGISWIDDCRIPTSLDDIETSLNKRNKGSLGSIQNKWETDSLRAIESTFDISKGRFPANIIVSDDMLNDGSVSKGIKSNRGGAVDSNSGTYSWNEGNTKNVEKYLCGFNDKGTNSRYYDIDKWFENLLD
jgi:hypothetical protein